MIEREPHGEVTVFRMAHGKANAQDIEFCRELTQSLHEHAESSSRALIMTGRGNVFSAGVDLLRALEGGSDYLRAFLSELNRCFEALFTHSKPVVAAVNGHAIAGGCILAAAADRRLMSRGPGRIGVPELLVGVPFPPIALEIVRNALGTGTTESFIFAAETVDPETALACGLVHELVDEGDLMKRAMAAAEHLARIRPEVYTLTKQQLRQPAMSRVQMAGAVDAEVEAIWTGSETIVAMQEYVSRTFKKA